MLRSDGLPTPGLQGSLCEHCGAPARVYILEGYVDGRPLRRRLCLECANVEDEHRLVGGVEWRRPQPSAASLLTSAGLLLVVFGALVDQLGIQTTVGFGLKQQTGLLVGALVVVLGGLLRVDVLTVAGAILFALAALADVMQTVGSPGVGWQQGATILVGLLFLLAGLLLWSRRLPGRESRAD